MKCENSEQQCKTYENVRAIARVELMERKKLRDFRD